MMASLPRRLSLGLPIFLLGLAASCTRAIQPTQGTAAPTSGPDGTVPLTGTAMAATGTLGPIRTPTTQPPGATRPGSPGVSYNGPWLVYSSSGFLEDLVIVNEDGSGATRLAGEVYDPADPSGICDDARFLVVFSGFDEPILICPHQLAAYRLIPTRHPTGDPYHYWQWDVALAGDPSAGMLATIYEASDTIPELLIHEVPGGDLRARLPLVRCPENPVVCETWQHPTIDDPPYSLVGGPGQFTWSWDGRYLAFAALWDGPTTDLYLYDAASGNVTRLTAGQSHIIDISWSPEGEWIAFEAIEPFDESSPGPLEHWIWATTADGSNARRLYTNPWWGVRQAIQWLDTDRFVSYDGQNPVDDAGITGNLRLVNVASGQVRTLYQDNFIYAELDPVHEVVAVYTWDGTFLVSVADPSPRYVGTAELDPSWNRDLGMFLTTAACEGDPQGRQAFTFDGQIQCVHLEMQPQVSLSPDGQWQIVTDEGLWLERATGERIGQLSEDEGDRVLWRPDSAGFFLAARDGLYHFSVPDLSGTLVDPTVSGWISFEWLSDGVP